MKNQKSTAQILQMILILIAENADVRDGLLSNGEFRQHCIEVEKTLPPIKVTSTKLLYFFQKVLGLFSPIRK